MASDAAMAQAMYAMRTSGYAVCASLTFAAYEALVNFDREVVDVWCWKTSNKGKMAYCIPILLVILRWTPILQLILQWINNPPSICTFSIAGSQVLYIIMALALAAFGSLRIFTLAPCHKRTLAIATGLLMGVPPMFGVLSIVRASYTFIGPPFNQCVQLTTIDQRTNTIMSWVALAFATSGSFLVLLVTWRSNFKQYREGQEFSFQTRLPEVLVKGGAVYFILLVALNVPQLVLLSLSDTTETIVLDAAYVQPFLQVTPSIIVCRFILELREASQPRCTMELSSMESVVYERPLVNEYRGGGVPRGSRQPGYNGRRGLGAMENLSDIMLDEICVEHRAGVPV